MPGSSEYGPSLRDTGSDLFTFIGLTIGGVYAGYIAWKKSKEARRFMMSLFNIFSSVVLPMPEDEDQLKAMLSDPKLFKSYFETQSETLYGLLEQIDDYIKDMTSGIGNAKYGSMLDIAYQTLKEVNNSIRTIEDKFDTLLVTKNSAIVRSVINESASFLEKLNKYIAYSYNNISVLNEVITYLKNSANNIERFADDIKTKHKDVLKQISDELNRLIDVMNKKGEKLLSRLFSNYEKYERILRYFIEVSKTYMETITSMFMAISSNIINMIELVIEQILFWLLQMKDNMITSAQGGNENNNQSGNQNANQGNS